MALCALGIIPIGVFESCKKTSNTTAPTNVNFTVDLSNAANAALNTVGGYLIVNGIIVIRNSATEFSAFSAACTHEGATVHYNAGSARIVCSKHNGIYNATSGGVVSGPPPAALAKYTVTQSGTVLTVKS